MSQENERELSVPDNSAGREDEECKKTLSPLSLNDSGLTSVFEQFIFQRADAVLGNCTFHWLEIILLQLTAQAIPMCGANLGYCCIHFRALLQ